MNNTELLRKQQIKVVSGVLRTHIQIPHWPLDGIDPLVPNLCLPCNFLPMDFSAFEVSVWDYFKAIIVN